ncbi:hypothetical protein [Nocardia carnea]|nr:hypothetical protein [Nocardia carnea]
MVESLRDIRHALKPASRPSRDTRLATEASARTVLAGLLGDVQQ